MKTVLSIQSHVAYGYVGNRAAVFPLQRLGFDVTAINTVQFSNHTGYSDWEGDIFSPQQTQALIDGVRRRGNFPTLDALLTGYLGNPGLGPVLTDLVRELKSGNPDFLYCCDPVMGDVSGGCYVKPEIRDVFKQQLLPIADILTPNSFELNYLSDKPVQTLQEILEACDSLMEQGPRVILVTSVQCIETPANTIQMLLHQADGSWLVDMPLLRLDPEPNGAGDLTASLLLAHILQGHSPETVLSKVADEVFGVYEATHQSGQRELQLIAAQNELVSPTHHFNVKKIV
jgi:pyridoxine kinase